MTGRRVGVPALVAIGLVSMGGSIYFALGLVAAEAGALTPAVLLVVGLFFVLTTMTYLEGAALHPERGGASVFARYAFNETWSFVAGWAILLDYLIVMAIAALAIPHYLSGIWPSLGSTGVDLVIAVLAIAGVGVANVRGLHAGALRRLIELGLLNVALIGAVIVYGFLTVFEPRAILDPIEAGDVPPVGDVVFAAAVACVALVGIESASGLAGEIRAGNRALRRVLTMAAVGLGVLFLGGSVVALMAVPVQGGETALGGTFVEMPVLGVLTAFEPAWVAEALSWAVGLVGALVLLGAVNASMLGLSRLSYSLATNRLIPSGLGRLHPTRSTPYVAIGLASLAAVALALTGDVRLLGGIFAFGAMVTFFIAHVSVIGLRLREGDRRCVYRMPFSVPVGGWSLPLPAVLGALLALGGWVSVIVLHEGARVVGGLWLLGGLALFVFYRVGQGESLTERFTVPASALQDGRGIQYVSLLVPVFGESLDDDIVGTAGRLAAEEGDEGEPVTLEALYVLEVPLSLPLDARLPDERLAAARTALNRARAVGEEYAGVHVATQMVRGRSAGAAIVEQARRKGVEAIVLAADEPSAVRGGGRLGGRGRPKDRFVDEMTRYVMEKATCRVLLTAAPAPEDGRRPRPGALPPAAPPAGADAAQGGASEAGGDAVPAAGAGGATAAGATAPPSPS